MEMETGLNTTKQSPNLFGMFTSPGEQFERIKQNPKIWVPLIISTIIYAVGTAFLALSMDVETIIEQGVSKDQADFVLGIAKVTALITGIFVPIIGILFSTVIHLIIAKIANSVVTFKQLFSMNTYIMIIGATGLILNMAIKYAIGGNPQIYITSLAGVLNLDKPGLYGSIEVFGIWGVILTAIGLNKTADFSKGLAWTIVIVLFLIGMGFGLLATLFQGAPKL